MGDVTPAIDAAMYSKVVRRLQPIDLVAIVVILAAIIGYSTTAATVENFGSDTSTYYGLARSLRFEHRYWFNFVPHTVYPPGFPLMLAAFMALGAETFGTLVKCCIALYFIGVVAVYLMIKRQRGAQTALAIVGLLVTSSVFYFWSTVGVHSEAAYFTVSMYGLLCTDVAESAEPRRVRVLALAGVALFGSYLLLVRSIGVTFIAGVALWISLPLGSRASRTIFWSRRRLRRWGLTIAGPVVVAGVWTLWSAANRPPEEPSDYMSSYVRQLLKEDPHQIDSPNVSLKTLPSRTLHLLTMRIENVTRTVLNLRALPLGWRNPVCLLVFAIVAAGWLATLLRRSTIAHWYLLAYLGMLLIYPFDEGTRYLHPVQPLLLLYAFDGFEALTRHVRARGWLRFEFPLRAAAAVVVCAIALLGLWRVAALARANMVPDASRFLNATTVETAQWINDNTPLDAVVMDDQSAILHRLSGRKTLRFPLSTDVRVLRDQVTATGTDFVVVLNERPNEYYNPSTMRRFAAVKVQYPTLFVPVHTFRNGAIYRVTR